jgi:hypothetical protein
MSGSGFTSQPILSESVCATAVLKNSSQTAEKQTKPYFKICLRLSPFPKYKSKEFARIEILPRRRIRLLESAIWVIFTHFRQFFPAGEPFFAMHTPQQNKTNSLENHKIPGFLVTRSVINQIFHIAAGRSTIQI